MSYERENAEPTMPLLETASFFPERLAATSAKNSRDSAAGVTYVTAEIRDIVAQCWHRVRTITRRKTVIYRRREREKGEGRSER